MKAVHDSSSSPSDPFVTADEKLRARYYNATVESIVRVHDDLVRIAVRADDPPTEFLAGQYVTLGLGRWEKRVPDCQAEPDLAAARSKMVRRAYSVACRMLTPTGTADCPHFGKVEAVNPSDRFEFYVVLVREASTPAGKPPALTPRIFALDVGDRLELGRKITGHYTLEGVRPNDNVWMIGTGTGEAPHNAMLAELLHAGHRGRIINVTTVRGRADLGYIAEHTELMRRFEQYHYLPLTTRDAINIDPSAVGYVGKRYIQDAFQSGWLSDQIGDPLLPTNTHVFLCGNPAMIGYVPPGAPPLSSPGMLQILTAAGYHELDAAHGGQPTVGSIRFEKYW